MHLKGSAKAAGSLNCFPTSGSHEKCSPQLKPPLTIGEDVYSNVSALIISIMGHTTVDLFSTILLRRGGSQSLLTSQ